MAVDHAFLALPVFEVSALPGMSFKLKVNCRFSTIGNFDMKLPVLTNFSNIAISIFRFQVFYFVAGAVMRQHPELSSVAVHHQIAQYLKMAPHRKGGAGRGCYIPQMLQATAEYYDEYYDNAQNEPSSKSDAEDQQSETGDSPQTNNDCQGDCIHSDNSD